MHNKLVFFRLSFELGKSAGSCYNTWEEKCEIPNIFFLFVSTIINITTTCLTVWKVNLVYFLDELVLLIKLFLSSVPNAEWDHLS